jgi:16S rRNA (cytidine1402-2'-O)-methyltransferase
VTAAAGEPGAGVLTVVATPIGNLGDVSPRAAEVLRDVDLVLAEDTRRTATLLRHVGADTPMRSYHQHNEAERVDEVLGSLAAGARIALVSDAGTPGVSDPGTRLVAAAAAAGVTVTAVPGPSAALHALVVSGLPTERFAFEGFLPRKGRARRERLAELAADPRTLVLFVAPHRAAEDLGDLAEAFGADRPAALCRELTKLHEEVRRGGLGALAAGAAEARGELTLVVAGAPVGEEEPPDPADLVDAVRGLVAAEGIRTKDAVARVATTAGVSKRDLYQAVLDTPAG